MPSIYHNYSKKKNIFLIKPKATLCLLYCFPLLQNNLNKHMPIWDPNSNALLVVPFFPWMDRLCRSRSHLYFTLTNNWTLSRLDLNLDSAASTPYESVSCFFFCALIHLLNHLDQMVHVLNHNCCHKNSGLPLLKGVEKSTMITKI